MVGRETTPAEWAERLGTSNGNEIVGALHCFHERPLVLRDPIAHMETVTRPLLKAIDAACRDIAPLTLMEIARRRKLTITRSFADIVFDWGDIPARAENAPRDEPLEGDLAAILGITQPQHPSPLIEMANTTGVMLEERLIQPAFVEIARSLPIGSGLPRDIQHATYEGFMMTLTHLVVFLAINDKESAETLGPWFAFYANGNLPIGLTKDGTFLFLTR